METTSWDNVAEDSAVEKRSAHTLPKGAEDKILVAWPVILSIIDEYSTTKMLGSYLDFGCGTGEFTLELSKRSTEVMGIDSSAKMIELARKQNNGGVRFVAEDASEIDQKISFDCITSIMVLQYIDSIVPTLTKLVKHLSSGGLFVFAVHNPAYIEYCLEKIEKYVKDRSGRLWIRYRDKGAVEMFMRSAEFYKIELEKLGMKEFSSELVPFPPEYVEKYESELDEPFDIPKFLIMAFTKN